MNQNINDISEAIKNEKQAFLKSLLTPDNLFKGYSEIRDGIMILLGGFLPVISLVVWIVTGLLDDLHSRLFFLQAYTPALLFLLSNKKIFRFVAKRRFKNNSEEELLKEIDEKFSSSFYNENISKALHDKVKLALTMDEYKRLCYSGEQISNITYAQLTSFINRYEEIKNEHRIVEDNKLNIEYDTQYEKIKA